MEEVVNASNGLALTDAALQDLKEQSPEGCLLCVLSDMDEDDWD